jgi:hypothetical protein
MAERKIQRLERPFAAVDVDVPGLSTLGLNDVNQPGLDFTHKAILTCPP